MKSEKYKIIIGVLIILTVISMLIFQQVKIIELERVENIHKEKIEFLFKAYGGIDYEGKDLGDNFWQNNDNQIKNNLKF